jgi:hypothetical protein
MSKVFIVALLLVVSLGLQLKNAKVIEKVGDFMRKRTKFGEIFLHKEHQESEEVVLE